jgi:hypothetical protein
VPWVKDIRRVIMAAVIEAACRVRLVVLTAPGADVLPWDEDKCTIVGEHKHSGPLGCRVQQGPRDRWEEAFPGNWKRLREAGSQRCRRLGYPSPLVSWVDEDQGREVFHRNVLLEDTPAGRAFHAAMVLLAPRYGFGFVDRKVKRYEPLHAVNYLCGYLAGGASGKRARKTDVTAAAARAKRGRRVWVVSPRLTKRTGCTRRSLRRGRQVWAARQGLCRMPAHGLAVIDWRVIDCETGQIVKRVFPDNDDDDDQPAGG